MLTVYWRFPIDVDQENGFFLLLQSIEKIFSQIDSQRAFSKSFLLIKCLKCIKNVMQANIAVEFFINLSDNEENCSIRVFSKSNKIFFNFIKN